MKPEASLNPRISAIADALLSFPPKIQRMLALGLCEHFVYAAEYLSGIGFFTESLQRRWEWELHIADVEPQDFMPQVLEVLPTSDSDQALDLDERELLTVGSALLLENADKLSTGNENRLKTIFDLALDNLPSCIVLLGLEVPDYRGKPLKYAETVPPGFCDEYLCEVERMIKEMLLADLVDIAEWRIDRQRWGTRLRDRLEEAETTE